MRILLQEKGLFFFFAQVRAMTPLIQSLYYILCCVNYSLYISRYFQLERYGTVQYKERWFRDFFSMSPFIIRTRAGLAKRFAGRSAASISVCVSSFCVFYGCLFCPGEYYSSTRFAQRPFDGVLPCWWGRGLVVDHALPCIRRPRPLYIVPLIRFFVCGPWDWWAIVLCIQGRWKFSGLLTTPVNPQCFHTACVRYHPTRNSWVIAVHETGAFDCGAASLFNVLTEPSGPSHRFIFPSCLYISITEQVRLSLERRRSGRTWGLPKCTGGFRNWAGEDRINS